MKKPIVYLLILFFFLNNISYSQIFKDECYINYSDTIILIGDFGGRSHADSKSHNTPGNYMVVAVEGKDRKLFLYNTRAGGGGTIAIDKDTFKER